MGGGTQTSEDSGLGEEEGAGADGEKGALAGWVLLLDFGIRLDEAQWLGLVLEDDFGVAAGDDEDVEVGEAFVGLLEGDVGAEINALSGGDGLLFRGKSALEGFAACLVESAKVLTCSAPVKTGDREKLMFTWILGIVASVVKDLQGTDEVKGVKTLMQGKEDLDRFKSTCFTVLWNYCTHLAGIVV